MNLFNLAEEMGLEPRKTSTSHGGEYHCPCPSCGGLDRFMFWPEKNRYWCRRCDAKGDAINFCREFQGLSFHGACIKIKKELSNLGSRPKVRLGSPPPVRISTPIWETKAKIFTENSFRRLIIDKTATELILKRGLSFDTIEKHRLGWNPVKAFHHRSVWGLNGTEEHKSICLPSGIVIPLFENNTIRKLKIRKTEWKEGDPYGKYYEVPGSSNILPVFGNVSSNVTVIVEAELDAMLVVQEASNLCSCVALGGAQKRPNTTFHKWLQNRQLILFALDFDEAGKKEYLYWQNHYQNLEPWPVPEEKSPGDYFVNGGNLREWISSGIKNTVNYI